MAADKKTTDAKTTGPDEAEAEQRAKDRAEAEAAQEAQRQAVFDATHDEDGNPIPIVPPELPQPPGAKVFGGKQP
jgi:hypothetical protein